VVWVAAIAGVLGTARLGLWQLHRAAQKLNLQEQILQRATLPTLTQSDLPRTPGDGSDLHHRKVSLRGRWLPKYTVYLDNRQMNGRPGFFVVTPLKLADGTVVPVQRGWLARDFIDRARLASVGTPSGDVEVLGRLAPPPSKLFQLGGADSGVIRQNLDFASWALEIHHPLPALSVLQTEAVRAIDASDIGVSEDGLLRQWPVPAVDVGKHHGYALQWFAMSALIAGLACWHLLIRTRSPHFNHQV
jgi:surfeit locus 1 family protein